MNESLFNDASPTNLHVVTSLISTYMQLPLNSDICAIRRFSFTAHRPNAVYTVSEKVHPLTFDDKLL